MSTRANHALICVSYARIMRQEQENQSDLDKTTLLTRLFGVLDPSLDATPQGLVVRTKIQGFWRVSEYRNGSSFTCLCGRSDPFFLPSDHVKRHPPRDASAGCHVCQNALHSATTKAERLAAWLDSRRSLINREDHLELPDDCGQLYIKDPQESNSCAIIRTRHFVYTHFYRKPVPPGFCVTSTCRNSLCLNPHHLCLSPTRRSKLDTRIRTLIEKLSSLGMSPRTIQLFLQEEHSVELSVRSVQRTVKEAKELKNCVF